MMYFDKTTIQKKLVLILFILGISYSCPSNSHAQNWQEMVKSLASDKEKLDFFGYSVSISGDYAIVGATGEDTGGGGAGAAYIFHKDEGGTNNWREVQKIQASDKEASDAFGISVSISGDYAIVGAYGEDTGGDYAGAAYIFHKDKGGTNNWGEVQKIQASDKEAEDYFGYSVSISGSYAIVGADGEDTGEYFAGAAYIFHKDEGGPNKWGEVQKIQASDKEGYDYFGESVSISGDYAIVGAGGEETGGVAAGAAYIFHKDEGGIGDWVEVQKIQASDKKSGAYFGSSVSISGDYAIVGAYREYIGGSNAGAAYIFHKDEGGIGNWSEVQKIQASDKKEYDYFGESVSISGDHAIVGARGEDTGGHDAGAAYIFHKDEGGTNNWGEVQKIQASDKEAEDYFGRSVFISGDHVIVGASSEDTGGDRAGASYIFQFCEVSGSVITGELQYCAIDLNTTLDAGTWASYKWSNGEETQMIEASEGTYTVTVTNSNGCTGTDEVTVVKINDRPTIIGELEYCATDLNTTLDTGTWTSYQWSNGETGQEIEVSEGTYTLTVTNTNGCTGTDEVTVVENENSNPSISGNLAYCTSDLNTTLDAGTWTSYQWSNGETGQEIEVSAGTYTVTVSNSNDCTGTDEVTVIENENPVPIIRGILKYCASDHFTTLDAGNWASYQWSNGETSRIIEANAGTYTVTVTNSNDCTGTDEVTVTENANPIPSIIGDFAYCRGRQATLDAGVWETYAWSNGETAQSFSTTSIGVYTVTITNQEGCTGTAMAEVSATPCLAEAGILTTNQNTICAGEALEVSSTGNQTDTNYRHYFFVYSQDNLGNTLYQKSSIANYGTGTATASFGGLSAGDYLVCSYNECKDCLPNPSPVIFTTPMNDIYQTGTIQDGCFDIECVEVSVPEAFEPHASGTGIVAANNAAGQTIFIAEVCGGTMPYSIEFESAGGFATVNDYPSSMAGCLKYQVLYVPDASWTLTVTDANGCHNETVVFTNEGLIEESPLQIVSHEIGAESCSGYADGSISITVEGGSDDCNEYTYEWSGPNTFVSTVLGAVTGNEATGLASGKYDVTVTDCEGTTTTLEDINVTRKTRGRGRGRGGCKTIDGENPIENSVLGVYPNPFGAQTSIEFSLSESSKVWLSVYSVDGRKVVELLKGEEIEGELLQRMDFDAEQLQEGLYILEMRTESGERFYQKLMVNK